MKNLLLIGVVVVGLVGYVQLRGGAYESDPELLASGKVASISDGEEVDVTEHLTADAWTVVEFGAVW